MPKEIIDYIHGHNICVFTVEMPDGTLHGATVHYAYDEASDTFFFQTGRKSKKAEGLLAKDFVQASMVIGVDEKDMKTFQLDGKAQVVQDDRKEIFDQTFFGKFPKKRGKSSPEDTLCFSFVPAWRRFTDWTGPEGKGVWLSTGK